MNSPLTNSRPIESRPDVLAGEPVIQGTRIAARHIANLIRMGASRMEVAQEFDITVDQIEDALVFVREVARDAAE